MSGDESNVSDDEFWNSFEKPVQFVKSSAAKPAVSTSNFASLRMSEKERYEKTIENIRESKEEEIRGLRIKILNEARKEFNEKLRMVKNEFLKESEKLKDTHASSRSIIQKKDAKITELAQIVITQEAVIADMRIITNKLLKNTKKQQRVLENATKTEDEKALKTQIEVFKELCENYKEEVSKYRKLNEKLEEEVKILKIDFGELETKIKTFSNEMIEKLQRENNQLQVQFDKYRLESEKEVEVRELLNKRHLQIISHLQEELKLAKTVIKSPRIHHKAVEKVKEFSLSRFERTEESPLEQRKDLQLSRRTKFKGQRNYTYKEYKAFDMETLRNDYYGTRSISRTSRLELIAQKSANSSYFHDSQQKLSKNNLYYKDDPPV